MGRERTGSDAGGVDLSTLTYRELYHLAMADSEADLRGLQHRWSKKADELQERANFLYRAAAAMPAHWGGAAGRAFVDYLSAEARFYEDSARVLYHNSNVMGNAAVSLATAQKQFQKLEAQGLPKPDNVPEGTPVWRNPADDPRQKEAYRTIINLSSDYLTHHAHLQEPRGGDVAIDPVSYPRAGMRTDVPESDRAGSSPTVQHHGSNTPSPDTVITTTPTTHNPGPILAGSPGAATPPAEGATGTGPSSASSVPGRIGTGGLPVAAPTNGVATVAPSNGPVKSGSFRTLAGPPTHPSRATGMPFQSGTSGTGMLPSAQGGQPPEHRRRGRGTDLKEDPELWMRGIYKGAPPLVGRNCLPAANANDDDVIVPIDVQEVQALVADSVPVGNHRITNDGTTFEVRVTRGSA